MITIQFGVMSKSSEGVFNLIIHDISEDVQHCGAQNHSLGDLTCERLQPE